MENIVAILSGACAAAFVSGLFGLINRALDKKSDTNAALVIILYDRVKYLGKKYIDEGCISADDLCDLIKMHEVYHRLGGNGFLDEIMKKVKALPMKEEAA